jgi:hypothetical protein
MREHPDEPYFRLAALTATEIAALGVPAVRLVPKRAA